MYRIIIIFCISFFSVSFLRAEKMPDSFESDTIDISKTWSFFDNLIQPKEEFETTKDYYKRTKKQIVNSTLFKGNSDQYFYAPVEDLEFSYDADKQEGTFEGTRIISIDDSDNQYRFTLKQTKLNFEKYMGTNSFGVEKEISSWDENVDVIVFHNKRNDVVHYQWTMPMDTATAKAAKQNFKAVVRFQIAPQENIDKLVLFQDTDYQSPTINSPYRIHTVYKGIYVQSVSLIFYNQETNEIFWNIDFVNYKDQNTLKMETEIAEAKAKQSAEKKAKKKKEQQHAKRVSEFYQDWETPEGDFFGKFVKTQKNFVFFEKEDGTQVQVDYDDLSPQYQDLLKVAKIFKKVMNTLRKPRVWDTDSDKKYKATIIKVEIETDFYSGNEFMRLTLKQHNGEIRVLSPSRLSERDEKWFESTYNEFSKARQQYEEKYSVNLMKE